MTIGTIRKVVADRDSGFTAADPMGPRAPQVSAA